MSIGTTAPTTWAGWFRPRDGAWRKVVSAPTAAERWGMLLGAIASLPSGDSLVLPSDREPTTPRRERITR